MLKFSVINKTENSSSSVKTIFRRPSCFSYALFLKTFPLSTIEIQEKMAPKMLISDVATTQLHRVRKWDLVNSRTK